MAKLSAYNKHMRAEMKRGKTFKQAAASWKGGKKRTKQKKQKKKKGKVYKQRVSKKEKKKSGGRHTGMFKGISKRGLIFLGGSFLLSNGIAEMKVLKDNGFSAAAFSEVITRWRQNSLGYWATLYSVYKYGDAGILSSIDGSMHFHRKAAATQLFSATYTNALPRYYLHFKTNGITTDSLKTAGNTVLTQDMIPAGVMAYSLYKYGLPVTVGGK